MRNVAALTAGCCALAAVAAGCGAARSNDTTTTPLSVQKQPAGLRVGTVGSLRLQVAGAAIEHVTLARLTDQALVLVPAAATGALRAVAVDHPHIHFAVVGGSARGLQSANVTGIVLRDDQAARLAGAIAALGASEGSGRSGRIAWVGPGDTLVDQFVNGAHEAVPSTVILRAFSADVPASCKEAALGAIARGATVVFARAGLCADAAVEGAHQQNQPAIRLSDLELPGVAAVQIIREAVAGAYHRDEDVVFGASSGAVAVRRLDPRFPESVIVRARAAAEQLVNGFRLTG